MIEQVQLLQRNLIKDERGCFLKIITGTEDNIPSKTGEVYLTMGKPGQSKGGHYHSRAVEWFTVIAGEAILKLEDIATHQKKEVVLSLEKALTVFVPNGVAHKFVNIGDLDFVVLAYTDRLYDPTDTISYDMQ